MCKQSAKPAETEEDKQARRRKRENELLMRSQQANVEEWRLKLAEDLKNSQKKKEFEDKKNAQFMEASAIAHCKALEKAEMTKREDDGIDSDEYPK